MGGGGHRGRCDVEEMKQEGDGDGDGGEEGRLLRRRSQVLG